MAKIKDLKPNKFNPRTLSGAKKDALQKSLEEFGDLGGIVFNTESGTIVSGHQRSSVLPQGAKIQIEKKFETPTKTGTVAIGFIEDESGERFSYREVQWSKQKESEALLAANKHSGEWDTENLRLLFADNPTIRVELTGFNIPELKMMNIEMKPLKIEAPKLSIPGPTIHAFDKLAEAQKTADSSPISTSNEEKEESDAEYIKKETMSFEQIDQEKIPPKTEFVDTTNAFERLEEKQTVEAKRIILIIDCQDLATKKNLREKVLPLLEGTGAFIV